MKRCILAEQMTRNRKNEDPVNQIKNQRQDTVK
jgi:hypothetical protein